MNFICYFLHINFVPLCTLCIKILIFSHFCYIYYNMLGRTLRNRLKDLEDLSPWLNDDYDKKQLQQIAQKPTQDLKPKRRKLKKINPSSKSITERIRIQKFPIQSKDYELPVLKKKHIRSFQQWSNTIEVPHHSHLNIFRNKSSRKLIPTQSQQKNLQERKLTLNGVKYDMVHNSKRDKYLSQQPRPLYAYMNNNSILLFAKNKDDILKRVLGQIKGRIKQLGENG